MTPYSFESFITDNINNNNDNITTMSLENFGGHLYDDHQSLLSDLSLDDINQYLLEVPLQQPEPISPPPKPDECYHLDDPSTIRYNLFQQGCGPTPIPTLPQGYQTLQQGPEIKNNVDEGIEDSREKPTDNPHHHLQDSLRRRAQKRSSENKRRRERINARIRSIQELIPHCSKGNHATILEHAIEYIKSLKLYIDAMSRLRSEQGQVQAPYATQMMSTEPWPRMFHGIGSGPWAWGPQLTQVGYPTLNPTHGLGGFGVGGLPHGHQVPFTPMLCRLPYLTNPIMTTPTPALFPFATPQSQSTAPPSSFDQAPQF